MTRRFMIPKIKDAKDFESYVSFVYDILLNSTGDGIQLSQKFENQTQKPQLVRN